MLTWIELRTFAYDKDPQKHFEEAAFTDTDYLLRVSSVGEVWSAFLAGPLVLESISQGPIKEPIRHRKLLWAKDGMESQEEARAEAEHAYSETHVLQQKAA